MVVSLLLTAVSVSYGRVQSSYLEGFDVWAQVFKVSFHMGILWCWAEHVRGDKPRQEFVFQIRPV